MRNTKLIFERKRKNSKFLNYGDFQDRISLLNSIMLDHISKDKGEKLLKGYRMKEKEE